MPIASEKMERQHEKLRWGTILCKVVKEGHFGIQLTVYSKYDIGFLLNN